MLLRRLRVDRFVTEPAAAASSDDGTSWRDVTVEQFRRYNLVSTILGVLIFGAGLGLLVLYVKIVLGLTLIVVGSAVGLWTAALRVDGLPAALVNKRAQIRPGLEQWSPRVVHFYTRENCTLCDEAHKRLTHDLDGTGIQVIDHDVDHDTVLQRRYGDRVPVAVHEGAELFALGYDADAVAIVARSERAGAGD